MKDQMKEGRNMLRRKEGRKERNIRIWVDEVMI